MSQMLKQDKHYVLFGISDPIVYDSAFPEIRFELHALNNPSDPIIFLGGAKSGTNTKGFLQYLDLLNMELNQANYLRIIEAFDFMHPWEDIFQNSNDFDDLSLLVSKKNNPKIKMYERLIHPVEFQTLDKEGGKITFWTRDLLSGHLKRWVIVADGEDKIQLEEEVVENYFFATLM